MRRKRTFDVLVTSMLLVLLLPVFLLVGAAVLLLLGRPILFCQQRTGQRGKRFHLVKFRTMRNAFDDGGRPLSDRERLTRLGRLLRQTSLDELPSLFNVLAGHMSLVGPRPLLPEYLPRYSARQWRRHVVRPGLTGWAQVNGRNSISWEQKFELDVWYVENRSFRLDLRILARTLVLVLLRRDINQPGQATAEPFQGTAGGREMS